MWLQISFRKLQKKEKKEGGREEGKTDSQSQAQRNLYCFLDDGHSPQEAVMLFHYTVLYCVLLNISIHLWICLKFS